MKVNVSNKRSHSGKLLTDVELIPYTPELIAAVKAVINNSANDTEEYTIFHYISKALGLGSAVHSADHIGSNKFEVYYEIAPL